MIEDTISDMILLIERDSMADKISIELALCFDYQFGTKTKLSNKNAEILHKVLVNELKELEE